ncbi:MAG: hypothetical protein AAF191_20575 [Verrucomicrobiota bacterium]
MEKVIHSGSPFVIDTASGKSFRVDHQDFVSFPPKRTTLIVSHKEDGEESFSMVPLLTITSATTWHPTKDAPD